MMRRNRLACIALSGVLLTACSGDDDPPDQNQNRARLAQPLFATEHTVIDRKVEANPQRNAYFGDLHVHTTYSFDAYAFGTLATPYDAYRFARGEAIQNPAGFDMQLSEPLDFYAVTDHAMFLGAVKAAADTSTEFSKFAHVQDLHNLNVEENLNIESLPQRIKAFSGFLPATLAGISAGDIDADILNQIAKDAWADSIAAAQIHNKPGKFTTFVAYEFTSSTDDRGNLHRNVIFQNADKLPAIPFSRYNFTLRLTLILVTPKARHISA